MVKLLFFSVVSIGALGILVYLRMLKNPRFGVRKYHSSEEKIEQLVPILGRARRKVLVRCWNLGNNNIFWTDDRVLKAVQDCLDRDMKFEFACSPRHKNRVLSGLREKYPDGIKFYPISKRILPDMIVIDGKYINWDGLDSSGITLRDKGQARKLTYIIYETKKLSVSR